MRSVILSQWRECRIGVMQGCSLGLDVSVSRRSRDVVSKRLGLVSVSWKCGKVSVSISSRTENQTSRSRTIGSRLHVNMHSFLLHCKNARRPLHRFECTLFVWTQRNLAALEVWSIATYSPNFVNFDLEEWRSRDTMRRHASVLHWYTWKVVFRQLPHVSDSYNGLSVHCVTSGPGASFLYKCPTSRGGSMRQHGLLVSFLAIRMFRTLLLWWHLAWCQSQLVPYYYPYV